MTCYHPIKAYQLTNQKTINDKKLVVFKRPDKAYINIKIPCGSCIGCRIARSRAWALRCVHEAELYDDNNCFITLTYNDENLPPDGSLNLVDFQKFMKRLRDNYVGAYAVDGKYPIRYFHCGEYGEKLSRPHHHAAIFNFKFDDLELWQTRDGVKLYRSESLERLWAKQISAYDHTHYNPADIFEQNGKYFVKLGFCTVGEITLKSAAYIARYCTKKIFGKSSETHYINKNIFVVDKSTGEIHYQKLHPEYITMSRRPGIARKWYQKYKMDLYSKDFTTYNGEKFPIPKYYDKLFDVEYPEKLMAIKKIRIDKSKKNAYNNTDDRLKVRERIMNARHKKLIRSYENET